MADKPEALRLADALENLEATGWGGDCFALTKHSEQQAQLAADELRRLAGVEAERDALRSLINNVLRCRYPVCTTICSSGYGWDIPRLNEVIDAAKGGGNG